jgi:hypothetical protein
MAIHESISSLVRESLREYLIVANYCVKYRKQIEDWGDGGCYGYPVALLLMTIVDAIGSYVIGGRTREHFEILNHPKYYNLGLSNDEIELFYKDHRCLLAHNAALSLKAGLSIGEGKKEVIETRVGRIFINLEPFLKLTEEVVEIFLKDADNIINSSQQINNILKDNIK